MNRRNVAVLVPCTPTARCSVSDVYWVRFPENPGWIVQIPAGPGRIDKRRQQRSADSTACRGRIDIDRMLDDAPVRMSAGNQGNGNPAQYHHRTGLRTRKSCLITHVDMTPLRAFVHGIRTQSHEGSFAIQLRSIASL